MTLELKFEHAETERVTIIKIGEFFFPIVKHPSDIKKGNCTPMSAINILMKKEGTASFAGSWHPVRTAPMIAGSRLSAGLVNLQIEQYNERFPKKGKCSFVEQEELDSLVFKKYTKEIDPFRRIRMV